MAKEKENVITLIDAFKDFKIPDPDCKDLWQLG